jgi:4-deoxy-L-threo-5-hexosulose-uronate ketol-isomerase
MKTNYEVRYASHPQDAKQYDTARLRKEYLVEKVFSADEVNMVYTLYDRLVVGGAMPVKETLTLEAIDPLKSEFFLSRRELGIYNVGAAGKVIVDGVVFELNFKEALYLGCRDSKVTFESIDAQNAKFYFQLSSCAQNFPRP